jgi:multimeric flavodoxin WrbA
MKGVAEMEIVCILGSPRKNGNSATIAKRFCEKAETLGAKTQYFYLNELDFKGCQGCQTCKTKMDYCVVEDDLKEVLDAVRKTDILVLATPVYIGNISGQTKCFIDRTFSFSKPDFRTNPNSSRLPPGKKAVFITAQGATEEMFKEIHETFKNYFKRTGFEESYHIRGYGVRALGDAEAHAELMDLAEKTAEEIMT